MFDLFEGKRMLMYGMTPSMIQCVKNAMHELKTKSISDVLNSLSNNPEFSQDEINIVLFEFGRQYQKERDDQKC